MAFDGKYQEWKYRGWRVVFDPNEIDLDEPGNGTPFMVYSPEGESVTFTCAVSESACGEETIPAAVHDWLETIGEALDEKFEAAERDIRASCLARQR